MSRSGRGLSPWRTVPKGTAALVEDLKGGLPVGDLRRRIGWWTVPGAGRRAARRQRQPYVLQPVGAASPGGGHRRQRAWANRPFRLAVEEQAGFLQKSYTATGSVDLRCSLACFDDPKLATSVGYPLGLPASEVRQLVGSHPKQEITFQVRSASPGPVTTTDAAAGREGMLVWSPVLGHSTSVVATSKVVDTQGSGPWPSP